MDNITSIALSRLVARDLPIVGATYRNRKAPHDYMLSLRPGATIEEELPSVNYLPGGFQLVRKEVYASLKPPYYRADYGLNPLNPTQYVGEDVYFGWTVRDAGFDIKCDLMLTREVGHILDIDMAWPTVEVPD